MFCGCHRLQGLEGLYLVVVSVFLNLKKLPPPHPSSDQERESTFKLNTMRALSK